MDEPPNKQDETKPGMAGQRSTGAHVKPDVPTLTNVKAKPNRKETGDELPTLTNIVQPARQRPAVEEDAQSHANKGEKNRDNASAGDARNRPGVARTSQPKTGTIQPDRPTTRNNTESSTTPPQEDPAIPTLTRKFQPSSDTSPDRS